MLRSKLLRVDSATNLGADPFPLSSLLLAERCRTLGPRSALPKGRLHANLQSRVNAQQFRGFTLAEVIISAGVMLSLLGCLALIFHHSSNAMLKGTTQSELLAQLQVFSKKFTRAAQGSNFRSLSVNPRGVAFLVATDDEGRFQYYPNYAVPNWQRYHITYHNPDERRLSLREVPVVGALQSGQSPAIEDFGTRQPLTTYFSGGQTLLTDVEEAHFSQSQPGTVALRLLCTRSRALSAEPERLSVTMTARLRNGGSP